MKNKYNPEIRHRRSIRLRGYDYSQAGAYFVTICTWNRECLFVDVVGRDLLLNEFGRAAEMGWLTTSLIRPNIELDEYIVMPNHLHGIVVINDYRGVLQYAPIQKGLKSPSQTLGAIIRGFKSSVTKTINEMRDTAAIPVWQHNYYEHIIRNEDELNRIREYIINNPLQWSEDENNPLNIK